MTVPGGGPAETGCSAESKSAGPLTATAVVRRTESCHSQPPRHVHRLFARCSPSAGVLGRDFALGFLSAALYGGCKARRLRKDAQCRAYYAHLVPRPCWPRPRPGSLSPRRPRRSRVLLASRLTT